MSALHELTAAAHQHKRKYPTFELSRFLMRLKRRGEDYCRNVSGQSISEINRNLNQGARNYRRGQEAYYAYKKE